MRPLVSLSCPPLSLYDWGCAGELKSTYRLCACPDVKQLLLESYMRLLESLDIEMLK